MQSYSATLLDAVVAALDTDFAGFKLGRRQGAGWLDRPM
jgi:hypothetical protein